MKSYSSKYIHSHCIDLYFITNNRPIHILTYGNDIPSELNDMETNRKIQQKVARYFNEAEDISNKVALNRHYSERIKAAVYNFLQKRHLEYDVSELFPNEDDIIRMFVHNAILGFYSYDFLCSYKQNFLYELVAYPHRENNCIPLDIIELLPHYDHVEFINKCLIKLSINHK